MRDTQPHRPVSALAEDARVFLRANALPIGAAGLAMLLAFGLALTSVSLSVDEEIGILAESAGTYLRQGRPVVVLIRWLTTQTLPLPFFGTALALLFLLAASLLWAFLFMRAARQLAGHRGALLVFLVIATTTPVNAYYLMWAELNVSMSVGMVFAALAGWCSWLWAVDGWRGRYLATAAVFAVLAVGVYQSLVFVALGGVLIAQLAAIIGREPQSDRRSSMGDLVVSVKLAIPMLIALVAGAATSFLLIERGSYTATFIGWGNAGVDVVVGRLLDFVTSYLLGSGFVGGWVLLPTVVAGLALLGVLAIRGSRGGGWWAVVLFIVIVLMPFANSVALGAGLPNRAMQGVPLAAGAVWLLLALTLPNKRAIGAFFVAAALALMVWNSSVNSRLFLTELTTFETDRAIASRIVERLASQGWDGEPIPVVSVGIRPITVVEDHADDEAFGFSFYNELDDGDRTPYFLQAMGHRVTLATSAEKAAARSRATSMSDWPAAGSVVLEDGVAIIRFSEPTAQEPSAQ